MAEIDAPITPDKKLTDALTLNGRTALYTHCGCVPCAVIISPERNARMVTQTD